MYAGEPSPGGLLPMMTYEGSFSPKGVCFSGFRYNKRVICHLGL